jgi:hypothetical protein
MPHQIVQIQVSHAQEVFPNLQQPVRNVVQAHMLLLDQLHVQLVELVLIVVVLVQHLAKLLLQTRV